MAHDMYCVALPRDPKWNPGRAPCSMAGERCEKCAPTWYGPWRALPQSAAPTDPSEREPDSPSHFVTAPSGRGPIKKGDRG